MRTKGNYLNVKVGGTLDIGQPRLVAVIAKALREQGMTVLALDPLGKLLDEKKALKDRLDTAAPVVVSVRGDVIRRHVWNLKGGRPPARSDGIPARLIEAAAGRGRRRTAERKAVPA